MTIKEELLFDFAVNMPRVLVSGNILVLDHVKRLVVLSDTQIIVHNGKRYTYASGKGLTIRELKDERMLVSGEIEQIQFGETLFETES